MSTVILSQGLNMSVPTAWRGSVSGLHFSLQKIHSVARQPTIMRSTLWHSGNFSRCRLACVTSAKTSIPARRALFFEKSERLAMKKGLERREARFGGLRRGALGVSWRLGKHRAGKLVGESEVFQRVMVRKFRRPTWNMQPSGSPKPIRTGD
jgi:hypothetical protein